MAEQIFREKSLKKITSPDLLNDYIRIANPTIWLVLGAVVLLLVGAIIWGSRGTLETSVAGGIEVKDGAYTLCLPEEKSQDVQDGDRIVFADSTGAEYEILFSKANSQVLCADEGFDSYFLHVGGFSEGQWLLQITGQVDAPDGAYGCEVITDSIKPIAFIIN